MKAHVTSTDGKGILDQGGADHTRRRLKAEYHTVGI